MVYSHCAVQWPVSWNYIWCCKRHPLKSFRGTIKTVNRVAETLLNERGLVFFYNFWLKLLNERGLVCLLFYFYFGGGVLSKNICSFWDVVYLQRMASDKDLLGCILFLHLTCKAFRTLIFAKGKGGGGVKNGKMVNGLLELFQFKLNEAIQKHIWYLLSLKYNDFWMKLYLFKFLMLMNGIKRN